MKRTTEEFTDVLALRTVNQIEDVLKASDGKIDPNWAGGHMYHLIATIRKAWRRIKDLEKSNDELETRLDEITQDQGLP